MAFTRARAAKARDSAGPGPREPVLVAVAAAVTTLAWPPFLNTPLSPDEGGFLLSSCTYWRHYLTGLVPGLVLVVCLVRPTGTRVRAALVGACLADTAAAGLVGWAARLLAPVTASPDLGSGLSSPYRELWSLPARVRDPQLRQLQQVMAGPRAPRWMVVTGDSLRTWGVDASSAQAHLVHHYAEQATYGGWTVWRRTGGRHP